MDLKFIHCGVCGGEFVPTLNRHYISRADTKTGIAEMLSHCEEAIHDAFDCPYCGCQVCVQSRERPYILTDEEDEEIE